MNFQACIPCYSPSPCSSSCTPWWPCYPALPQCTLAWSCPAKKTLQFFIRYMDNKLLLYSLLQFNLKLIFPLYSVLSSFYFVFFIPLSTSLFTVFPSFQILCLVSILPTSSFFTSYSFFPSSLFSHRISFSLALFSSCCPSLYLPAFMRYFSCLLSSPLL